ncbi:MAG: 2-amino-4-hydroxy-6-hydroxymethyldihydropteridine diphosphokinase [Candidatus Kapabacteria bacterium]|nr:2-amino-4-hydroxy-6-hydroxymethyldihydropteridine diphosphokinase [Candidatus Kapabacteria bacterium]
MHTVLLSLGANIGDIRTTISRAIELIGQTVLLDVRVSPLYQTAPVGFTEQPDFLNCAVVGLSSASARQIHDACKDIERQLGRQQRERWHEREIDIDVILVGDVIYDEGDVHIPHLRMHERLFVLQPACDLIPNAVCPRTGKTLEELVTRLLMTDD